MIEEVNTIEKLTAEIGNAEQAALIMRGRDYRAQARDLRLHAESTIAERITNLDEPEREIFLLLEDVQRVLRSRRENPALAECLIALARYEAKLDDKLRDFAQLFAKFRYRYLTGLPLESAPAKVQQAIDIALSINVGEVEYDGLFELAANIRECLSPKPKPQPKTPAPENKPADTSATVAKLELPSDFGAIPDTKDPAAIAAWIKGEVSNLLRSDWLDGVPPTKEGYLNHGQLNLLREYLRIDIEENLPQAVKNNNLKGVMEIVGSVIFTRNEIGKLLRV